MYQAAECERAYVLAIDGGVEVPILCTQVTSAYQFASDVHPLLEW